VNMFRKLPFFKPRKAPPLSQDDRARHVAMISSVENWPHQVVLPMYHADSGNFGFLLSDEPGVLFFGFIAAIPNEALEALHGNAEGAPLEAWKRNQRQVRFASAEAMIDAGWSVD
jgi:hypothetical protein